MTAIIFIYTGSVDSCKVHIVSEGKIQFLATVAKSKPILLVT